MYVEFITGACPLKIWVLCFEMYIAMSGVRTCCAPSSCSRLKAELKVELLRLEIE